METTDWSRCGVLTTRGRPWPQTLPLANDQKCPSDQLNTLLFEKCDTSSTINRRDEKSFHQLMHFFSFLHCDKKTESVDEYA